MTRITAAQLAAILVAGAFVAGCGEGASSNRAAGSTEQTVDSGEAFQSTSTPTPGSDDFQPGSHSVIFLLGEGQTEPTSVRDLYSVFRRGPKPNDVRVEKFAKEDEFVGPDPARFGLPELGKPIYGDTRLVSGTTSRGVYAVPTTSQAICIGHFPSGGAGCGSPGPHGLTVDYDDASDGAPWILYGMAGDDVVSLDAVVAGKTHHARLGQNAYVLELPAAQREEPERLILHLRSGATDELPLG